MGLKNALVSVSRAADRAIELGCNFLLLVTGLGLLSLLTVVVVLRYGFESGFSFAPDLSELLFAIFVMAGIAQAARLGVHVATQLLLNGLEGRWRLGLVIIIHTVTASAYLVLAWYALQNAIIAHDQALTGAAYSLERGVWLPFSGLGSRRCLQPSGDRAPHVGRRGGNRQFGRSGAAVT